MAQRTAPLTLTQGVVGVIDPDAYAAGAVSTAWLSAAIFQEFMAIVAVGEMAAGSTVDAVIEQATTAAGAGAKPVTGAAITQLTQAGGDSDKQAVIAFGSENLDIANEFGFFRLTVTVASAASDMGALVIGTNARYGDIANHDAASVAELVAVV